MRRTCGEPNEKKNTHPKYIKITPIFPRFSASRYSEVILYGKGKRHVPYNAKTKTGEQNVNAFARVGKGGGRGSSG